MKNKTNPLSRLVLCVDDFHCRMNDVDFNFLAGKSYKIQSAFFDESGRYVTVIDESENCVNLWENMFLDEEVNLFRYNSFLIVEKKLCNFI